MRGLHLDWIISLFTSFWMLLWLQSCGSDHQISLSKAMIEDHLQLVEDAQVALEYKKQEVKGNFVRQYLSTREHVSHSVNDIYLPDTTDFGRRSYADFKYLTLEGIRLIRNLEKLGDSLLATRNNVNYQPCEKDLSLFSEIEIFDKYYLKTATNNTTNEKTIRVFIESLREKASRLFYLERLQGLNIRLLERIEAVQLLNQSTAFKDYFTQLSPFLFIPETEQIYASGNSGQAYYSGRIYAINRYDFEQGLFIKAININGSDIAYNPDNPSYIFTIPVEPNTGDSLDLELKAKAVTHKGADTTFSIIRKFKVVTCP